MLRCTPATVHSRGAACSKDAVQPRSSTAAWDCELSGIASCPGFRAAWDCELPFENTGHIKTTQPSRIVNPFTACTTVSVVQAGPEKNA